VLCILCLKTLFVGTNSLFAQNKDFAISFVQNVFFAKLFKTLLTPFASSFSQKIIIVILCLCSLVVKGFEQLTQLQLGSEQKQHKTIKIACSMKCHCH